VRIVANDFEMIVERVGKLKGFVLKGILITGKINAGLYGKEDKYSVKRKGRNS